MPERATPLMLGLTFIPRRPWGLDLACARCRADAANSNDLVQALHWHPITILSRWLHLLA
jgi:hypothetical protein